MVWASDGADLMRIIRMSTRRILMTVMMMRRRRMILMMMMMIDDWPARKFVQFSTIQLPPTHTSARRPIGPNLSRTASDDTSIFVFVFSSDTGVSVCS